MKKVRYYCDLCEKEVENNKHLLNIRLSIGNVNSTARNTLKRYAGDNITTYSGWNRDVCVPCAVKVGLTVKTELPAEIGKGSHDQGSLGNGLYDAVVEIIKEQLFEE